MNLNARFPTTTPSPANQEDGPLKSSFRLGETGHLAMELQPAFQKCFPEINQKQPSEPAAPNLNGEKDRLFLASNPANATRADPAAGNDAMQMRMQVEILPPRV